MTNGLMFAKLKKKDEETGDCAIVLGWLDGICEDLGQFAVGCQDFEED